MNFKSRTITGSLLILLGLFLIKKSFSLDKWILIYAIPSLILGIFILFNKKEDKIEQIKKVKGGKK